MELQDTSTMSPRIARAVVDASTVAVAVLVRAVYRTTKPVEQPEPLVIDDTTGPLQALNWGASVTLAGTVRPARVGDRFRRFRLSFDGRESNAVVFGPRRWMRRGDELIPSQPAPLEDLRLSAHAAFGGTYRQPPGELLGLPHPSLLARYEANPDGVGFHRTREEAEGSPLPAVEYEEQLVRDWADRPEPALFAPCPTHSAARMPTEAEIGMDAFRAALILSHPAPRRHIVEGLAVGSRVEVEGLTLEPLGMAVPPSPIEVSVRRRGRRELVPGSVRTVHLDADAGTFTFTFGHAFACPIERAPRSIQCEDSRR